MQATGTEKWAIAMEDGEESFVCHSEQSLLTAMIVARRTGIKVGCRNGGCGVCRVKVKAGCYTSLKMSRTRISEADEAERIVLACRVMPESDLVIEPMPLGQERRA